MKTGNHHQKSTLLIVSQSEVISWWHSVCQTTSLCA